MYEAYWKLSRKPFDNTTHPDFFFRSHTHQAALLKMRYVIENDQGAALLVGGSGSGKTYLMHMLTHELPDWCGPTVQTLYPRMSPAELLAYWAVELGADEQAVGRGEQGIDRTIRQFEQQLALLAQKGRRPIFVIDDAHWIDDPRLFQTFQLMLNFQQQPNKSFALVLVGDRSLLSEVQRNAPLDDRLAVKGMLQPLSREETEQYVAHRLKVAGTVEMIFHESALEALFELTGGVPRKINRLCDLALLIGYADQLPFLTAAEIDAVAEEFAVVVPD